ncbi:hypothetical protein SCHPADRAFT_816230 [Schizopora paradoxa]|uniref:BTB domain-containing protein n=1 Tax=Schizopora paradoxa TaxID=27342 RepID=A0A0H2S8H4_9AGAM|nr:hypothetical protein SCHPADRAFT_816230 [Schizopora paradoxa]
MEATGFKCVDPDFRIRCRPEDVVFGANRQRLAEGSQIFASMFDDAEANAEGDPETMDLIEDSTVFAVFLKLLHEPPVPFTEEDITEQIKYETKVIMKSPKNAIPLPILTKILELADKYMVKPGIVQPLHTHLRAHRMVWPLKVYGLAVKYGLDEIAHDTSMFLIHPPLHTYSVEEISVIPTAEALQKLLLLQHHRSIRLREILHDEHLFPHHYGECPRHAKFAYGLWASKKFRLLGKVNSGTDVAAEMTASLKDLGDCETCYKGWSAATEMLAYKCRRVPRRTDKMPLPDQPK